MQTSSNPFISQFSTRIENVPIIEIVGEYNYKEQRWIGTEISAMPDTATKTNGPLTKDEEGDWN